MRVPFIPYHQGRNDYSDRDGRKYAIAIHNTSNTASDENEASYADHRTDGVSSHFYVDGDSVIQSLDTATKAGHAGSTQGNENAIAVEIRGLNSWTRQQWLDGVAWDQLGRVLAWCIRNGVFAAPVAVRRASVAEMKANPTVGAFYGHDDMRRAWGGTTHTDPGDNFPWDRLLGAVGAALGGTTTTGGQDVDVKDLAQIWTTLGGGIWPGGYVSGTVNDDVIRKQIDMFGGVTLRSLADLIAAGQAADEARDTAAMAAIKALASGGTSVDTAAVIARIDQVAALESETVRSLQFEVSELRRRLAAAGGVLAAD